MCGIFGLIVHKDSGFGPLFIQKSLTTLARLSESRGKDSSGLVFRNESEGELQVFKGAVPLNYLLKRKEVNQYFAHMTGAIEESRAEGRKRTFAVMGHSR